MELYPSKDPGKFPVSAPPDSYRNGCFSLEARDSVVGGNIATLGESSKTGGKLALLSSAA